MTKTMMRIAIWTGTITTTNTGVVALSWTGKEQRYGQGQKQGQGGKYLNKITNWANLVCLTLAQLPLNTLECIF